MAKASIRAFLFDMDGLLLDTETLHTIAYMELTERLGHPQTEQRLIQFIGHSHLVSCKWLIEEIGVKATIDELIEEELKIYFRLLATRRPEPMPGVAEMFNACEKRGFKRALVSSSAHDQVAPTMELVMEHLGRRGGWKEHFDSICTGERVAERKPAPDLYLLAVKELGLRPEECVAFEDSPAGVSAAHAAGVRLVAVPNSYLKVEDVVQKKTPHVYSSLVDVHKELDRILA